MFGQGTDNRFNSANSGAHTDTTPQPWIHMGTDSRARSHWKTYVSQQHRWLRTDTFLDHWLFSPETQHVVLSRPITFYIRGVAASYDTSLAQYSNRTARTVPLSKCKIKPSEDEIVVSVYSRSRAKEFSIKPQYLIPREPVLTGEVLVVGGQMRGMLGVVKAKVGDRWEVSFVVDKESRDEILDQKDLVGLDSIHT